MEIYDVSDSNNGLLIEMPNEVWCLILRNLNLLALRLATVSKTFSQIVSDCVIELVSTDSCLTDSVIKRFKYLTTLKLYDNDEINPTITNEGIKGLLNLTYLD